MTILNLQISSGSDDASQFGSGQAPNLDNGYMTTDGADDMHGLLFRNVTIPAGSTINSASYKIYAQNTSYDDVVCRVACEDVDSPADFTTGTDNLYNRTKTTAYASVNVTNLTGGLAGWYELVDVTAPLQEVIDRGGWASGNDIALLQYGWTSGDMRQRTYDFAAGLGAKLDIDYTEGTPPAGGHAHRKTNRIRLMSKLGGVLT